jgi:hypothetical protein
VVRRTSPGQEPVARRRHRGVACRGRCAERRHARMRHRTARRAFRALSCLRDSRSSMEGDGRCRQSPNTGKLRRARGGSSESRLSDFASQSQLCDRALICLPPVLYATLHSHQIGRPSFLGSRASALRPAYRWLAQGSGVMLLVCAGGIPSPGGVGGFTPVERRKGRHRTKATRVGRRQGHPVRPCAWCAHPVYGDAVTVTFPDKAQVTFHVACLDQYRAVMWPSMSSGCSSSS